MKKVFSQKKAVIILCFSLTFILLVNISTCVKIRLELMSDYRYFWSFMEKNFALWGVAQENGFDVKATYLKYKLKIKSCKNELDFAEKIIMPITQAFQENGALHTKVLSSDEFKQLLALSSQKVNKMPKEMLLGFDNEYLSSVQKRLDFENKILSGSHFYKSFDFKTAPLENVKEYSHTIECKILKNGEIAYIDLNAMRYTGSDKIELDNFLNEINYYENLIIDIRGNRGGSDEFWYPIIDKLSSKSNQYNVIEVFNFQEYNRDYLLNCASNKILMPLQDNKTLMTQMSNQELLSVHAYCNTINGRNFNAQLYNGFSGDIFLLTDEHTFSSADGFATFCKNTQFATVVGQATGGDGAGGQLGLFALPYTDIVIRYNIGYGLNQDYTSNIKSGTTPDYFVPNNIDSLSFCMKLIFDKQIH